jgi:hypothetical protein
VDRMTVPFGDQSFWLLSRGLNISFGDENFCKCERSHAPHAPDIRLAVCPAAHIDASCVPHVVCPYSAILGRLMQPCSVFRQCSCCNSLVHECCQANNPTSSKRPCLFSACACSCASIACLSSCSTSCLPFATSGALGVGVATELLAAAADATTTGCTPIVDGAGRRDVETGILLCLNGPVGTGLCKGSGISAKNAVLW